MRSRNNLLLGAIAGAAIGYWLNSSHGRRQIKKLRSGLDEVVDTGQEKANQAISALAGTTEEVLDKGISLAEEAKKKSSEVKENYAVNGR
jgi:gas vesicle protein